MKVKASKKNYQFSPLFRFSSVIILALSAIGIALAIALFMFGMAWVFMGVYQGEKVNESHITWGIVMICLGSYLVLVNAFSLITTSLAVNKRSAKGTLLIAVVAILAIVPIVGGITILFTPIDVPEVDGNKITSKELVKSPSDTKENIVVKKPIDEKEKEELANKLRSLKLRIDQHLASEMEKQQFEDLLTEYRQKYPKHQCKISSILVLFYRSFVDKISTWFCKK